MVISKHLFKGTLETSYAVLWAALHFAVMQQVIGWWVCSPHVQGLPLDQLQKPVHKSV